MNLVEARLSLIRAEVVNAMRGRRNLDPLDTLSRAICRVIANLSCVDGVSQTVIMPTFERTLSPARGMLKYNFLYIL